MSKLPKVWVQYLFEFILAFLAFCGSFLINYWAGQYVRRVGARSPASAVDLFLEILPRWDLTAYFVWGFAALTLFAVVSALIWERERLPYILWMYALLISLRGFFVILTPMGSPGGAIVLEGSPLFNAVGRYLTFGNDLFFSGHASMPFLGFLIYSRFWVRWVFFLFSLTLAATVLLCRLHYSIDVASAYFITYALVRIHGRRMRPFYQRWIRRLFGRPPVSGAGDGRKGK